MRKSLFGYDSAGQAVWLLKLLNACGVEVDITNYGGTVTSILTPDRNGRFEDIVLGFDTLDGYLRHPQAYFGALLGRYASRIGGAGFELGDRRHRLAANSGTNSLHGGERGFDKRTWSVEGVSDAAQSLRLSYVSADGEEGYPGELRVDATYSLNDENELRLDVEARTTAETVVNLTDHSDFNLMGHGVGDILQHRLTIRAGRFLPVDDGLVPTGELRFVAGTPFDFRTARSIGDSIHDVAEQLKRASGYDHTYVLDGWDGSLRQAAYVYEPVSGRALELYTTQPGVHFYSGNFLNGTMVGKSDRKYVHRGTFYLGSQHFPNSPNQANFPSAVLRPGEIFRSTNLYRFTVDSTVPTDMVRRDT
jgi:aldose 1-epimerase